MSGPGRNSRNAFDGLDPGLPMRSQPSEGITDREICNHGKTRIWLSVGNFHGRGSHSQAIPVRSGKNSWRKWSLAILARYGIGEGHSSRGTVYTKA